MKRITAVVCFSIASMSVLAATAQQVETRVESAPCPSEPLSIYYASGEATLSSEAHRLVVRVGDHAAACKPDGIDLVTRINSGIDGEQAMALALARLGDIAEGLMARGVPSERIRVAARPGTDVFPPGLSEVEVIFRTTGGTTGDVATKPVPQKAPRLSGVI